MSRHGSAEIWGFQYGVTLGLGTLEVMARTGFFGFVVCALNCAFKRFPSKPSTILTYLLKGFIEPQPPPKNPSRKFTQRGNEQMGIGARCAARPGLALLGCLMRRI